MLTWVDIETTGLDHERDALLEVGLLVTDDNLVPKRHIEVVIDHDWIVDERDLDPFIAQMHGPSGSNLLAELPSGLELVAAEELLIGWLRDTGYDTENPTPLCGSSVHFDRRFLAHNMPRLEAMFHYRNIDVSTVKELARRWHPDVFGGLPPQRKRHRAYLDLLDTLDEMRHYRQTLFPTPTLA